MSTGLIGVQVKAAEVEVNGPAETLTAPKTSGLSLEPLSELMASAVAFVMPLRMALMTPSK